MIPQQYVLGTPNGNIILITYHISSRLRELLWKSLADGFLQVSWPLASWGLVGNKGMEYMGIVFPYFLVITCQLE